MTIIRRNLLQFCVCIVCVAGDLMVVSFSKHIANWLWKFLLFFVLKINNCFKFSHQSRDWLGVYFSLPKLWVPTNFHTCSLELGYQVILDLGVLWSSGGELHIEMYHLYMILYYVLFRCVFCMRISLYNCPLMYWLCYLLLL